MIIHGEQLEITDFKFEDFELVDYDPHPTIVLRSPYNGTSAQGNRRRFSKRYRQKRDLPWNLPEI